VLQKAKGSFSLWTIIISSFMDEGGETYFPESIKAAAPKDETIFSLKALL